MYNITDFQNDSTKNLPAQSQSIIRILISTGLVTLLVVIIPFLLLSLLVEAYHVLIFIGFIVGSSIYLLIKINNDKEGYF